MFNAVALETWLSVVWLAGTKKNPFVHSDRDPGRDRGECIGPLN